MSPQWTSRVLARVGSDRISRVRGCGSSLDPGTEEEEEEEEEETGGVAEIDPSDVSAARVSPGSYVRRQGERGRRAGACESSALATPTANTHAAACGAESPLAFTASFSETSRVHTIFPVGMARAQSLRQFYNFTGKLLL